MTVFSVLAYGAGALSLATLVGMGLDLARRRGSR